MSTQYMWQYDCGNIESTLLTGLSDAPVGWVPSSCPAGAWIVVEGSEVGSWAIDRGGHAPLLCRRLLVRQGTDICNEKIDKENDTKRSSAIKQERDQLIVQLKEMKSAIDEILDNQPHLLMPMSICMTLNQVYRSLAELRAAQQNAAFKEALLAAEAEVNDGRARR